jgi:hydrogenase/urease accessory protein HupE
MTALQWRLVWKAPLKAGLAGVATPDLPPDCAVSAPHTALVGVVVATEETVDCSRPLAGREIGLVGLENSVSDVLVRIAPIGQPVQAARLTAAETHVTVRARPDRLNVARTYFVLGVEHILAGYDHLLFVVSLVLLLRTGWKIAKTVTSFTLAHSITLAGASLGFLGLPRAPVESTIALSIVFLAVEIVKSDGLHLRWSERYPWAVAFGFGLLHGFGFAGALAEIGLPQGETLVALLTFNLGVEAGQLIIVAATLCVMTAVARFAPGRTRVATVAAAYVIGALSCAWFIARTFV